MKKYTLLLLMAVAAQLGATELIDIASDNFDDEVVASIAWLQTGDANYLAAGGPPLGTGAAQIEIYRFVNQELIEVTTQAFVGAIASVAWLQLNGTNYLAVGGRDDSSPANSKVIVYEFTQNEELEFVTDINDLEGNIVNSLAWLESGDDTILAVADQRDARLYTFSSGVLDFITSVEFTSSGELFDVAWLQTEGVTYLGLAGRRTGFDTPALDVYSFNGQALTKVAEVVAAGRQFNSIDWLQSGGNIYLAAGSTFGNFQIYIYRFEPENPEGDRLIEETTVEFGNSVLDVAWLESEDDIYLGAAGSGSASPAKNITVYSFDGGNLAIIASDEFGSAGNSIAWLQTSTFLAAGGNSSSDNLKIFAFCQNPIANDDSVEAFENVSVVIDVLANDQVDCATLVDTLITEPENGAVVINSQDGTVTYTPDPDFVGEDSFVYQICDEANQCDEATVSITVAPCPEASDLDVATQLNRPLVITVLVGNQTECTTLQNQLIEDPAHGMAIINSTDGTITYTPDEGFAGVDSFVYQICDTADQCSEATITVTTTNDLAPMLQRKYEAFCSLLP